MGILILTFIVECHIEENTCQNIIDMYNEHKSTTRIKQVVLNYEDTLFQKVFCKDFDKILKIDNTKMLNSKNELVQTKFLNELKDLVDLEAYKDKCKDELLFSKPSKFKIQLAKFKNFCMKMTELFVKNMVWL